MRGYVRLVAVAAAAIVLAAVPAYANGVVVEGNAVDCSDVPGIDLTGTGVVDETLSADRRTLSVRLRDDAYVITAVGIKGGPDHHLYTQGPFTGLTAPPTGNGQSPQIGHWFVCGTRAVQETPSPSATPDPSPEPTPTPTPTPTSTPTPTPTSTPTPTETPVTGSPEPTTAAVPVPTAVPGGGVAPGRSAPIDPLTAAGIGGVALLAGAFVARRHREHAS